jgi:hypothetical protein
MHLLAFSAEIDLLYFRLTALLSVIFPIVDFSAPAAFIRKLCHDPSCYSATVFPICQLSQGIEVSSLRYCYGLFKVGATTEILCCITPLRSRLMRGISFVRADRAWENISEMVIECQYRIANIFCYTTLSMDVKKPSGEGREGATKSPLRAGFGGAGVIY